MTTEDIRADALTEAVTRTIETIKRQLDLIADRAPGDFLDKRPVVQSLSAHVRRLEKAIAASPFEQPAAAPKSIVLEHVAVAEDGGKLRWMTGRKPRDCELYAAPDDCHAPFLYVAPEPAPSPATERAAFEWPLLPLLPEAVITTADGEAVFTAHQMQGYANAYGEMVRARASSANETRAEGSTDLAERAHLAAGQWANSNTPIAAALAYRDGFIAGARATAQAPDSAWRELCHRLYVELTATSATC